MERYSREERCVCVEYCPFFPDAEVRINVFKVNLDHAEVCINIFKVNLDHAEVCINIFKVNLDHAEVYINLFRINLDQMVAHQHSIKNS